MPCDFRIARCRLPYLRPDSEPSVMFSRVLLVCEAVIHFTCSSLRMHYVKGGSMHEIISLDCGFVILNED